MTRSRRNERRDAHESNVAHGRSSLAAKRSAKSAELAGKREARGGVSHGAASSRANDTPPTTTFPRDTAGSTTAGTAAMNRPTAAIAVAAAPGRQELTPRWPALFAGLCGALALLVPLFLYLRTLTPTINFIDSGELITDGWTLSITHPTGYPLYTLLAYAIEHTFGSPQAAAWRMNAFSAVMAAGACFCSYSALLTLMRSGYLFRAAERPAASHTHRHSRTVKRHRNHRSAKRFSATAGVPRPTRVLPPVVSWVLLPLLALAGALLLAGSITFWSWATQAKMYTLNLFFTALAAWLALAYTSSARYANGPKEPKKAAPMDASARRGWTRRTWLLHALALVTGLSFTNHLISVILFPAFLVYILISGGWAEIRTHFWTLLLTLLAPLLFYLYLPIRAAQHPLINWDDPQTLANFIRHVRGAQYANEQFDLGSLGSNFGRMLTIVPYQFGFVGLLALALPGLWWLWRARRKVLIFTLLLVVLDVAYSLTYDIPEIDAYYLPTVLALSWWMILGLGWLLEGACSFLLKERAAISGITSHDQPIGVPPHMILRSVVLASAALLALALPSTAIATNYAASDQHQNKLALLFVENAYAGFAPNALVISDNWDFLSPAWYYEHVLGRRQDVATVDIALMHYKWYYGYLQQQYPWLLAPLQKQLQAFMTLRDAWEAGQPVDTNELQNRYIGLIDSFIGDSLRAGRPVYLLPTAADDPDLDAVGQGFYREPDGLGFRMRAQPGDYQPPLPHFDLRGLNDGTVIQDSREQQVTALYPLALARLGAYYVSYKHDVDAILVLRESLKLMPDPQVSALLTQAEQQLRATGR